MTRSRVLHSVGNLDLGGGQKLTALVAASLDRDRFDVSVLSFGRAGHHAEGLRRSGIEVIELGLVRPLRRNSVVAFLRAVAILCRTVFSGRWDLVHTHMFASSVVVTPLARLAGARALGTAHRVYYGRFQTSVEWMVARLQDAIVVDSHAVGEILRRETRIPSEKYVVIHNGIDTGELSDVPPLAAARAAVELPIEATVVGEVAHLAAHKGQAHLIDAVALVRKDHPEVHLLLVGDGPARSDLEARVREKGLETVVRFTGARGDLPTVLTAIDVLALPSTFEGFGIVQAEAMYLGRPVVATSHGGSTEVVVDGETGYLVAFGDVDALADRIRRLVGDPALRDRMGAAGRRRVMECFTREAMAASYAALYRAVLEKSP